MSDNLESFFQELERRNIIADYANLDNFYNLKPEEKVIYLGIDCTAESLHVGHLFLLIQTICFAQKGFKILLILGGATSKIGDPSDKLKERPQLENSELKNYQEKIKNQLTRLIIRNKQEGIIKEVNFAPLESFYSDNPQLLSKIYEVLEIKEKGMNEEKWKKYLEYIWPLKNNNYYKILDNYEWLGKLSFVDFIDEVGRNISINYLLAKETIKQRLESGLSYSAFSYSLLQAYDFYYLYKNYNCHGQLGGSDQWGNLTTGLKLIRGFYPENKAFAFTCNLLVDKEGKKYSKSESGKKMLWLNSEKKDFCDFFRNMADEQAVIFIKQFTFLNEKQIEKLIKLNNPPRLRILQRILYELLHFFNYGKIGKNEEYTSKIN